MQEHAAEAGIPDDDQAIQNAIHARHGHGCSARCPYCGRVAPLVHVHGHAQCGNCGVNREPCCQP